MQAATDAKSAVEDAQRERRRQLEECGGKHEPRFFVYKNGRWVIKLTYVFDRYDMWFMWFLMSHLHLYRVPSDPEEATREVRNWIFRTTPPGKAAP